MLVLLQSAGNWKTIGGQKHCSCRMSYPPFHHPILAIIPGSVSIHVSDVSLGNAANVSVGDRVPQDTNNVLCCAGVCSSAAALGAAVKMIKLIRPSSGRVAAWPSKQ